MASKRQEDIHFWIKALRDGRDNFARELQTIRDHKLYSDAGKQHYTEQATRDYHGKAQDQAKAAWHTANQAIEQARADLQAAHAKGETRWDYGRLSFLQAEYAARLGEAVSKGSGPFADGGPAGRTAAMRQEALETGDIHRMRALRLVALPVVEKIKDSNLRHAFEQDALNETPAEVRELRGEIEALERLQGEVRREILATEKVVNPEEARLSVFRSQTPWQREILGEDDNRAVMPGATLPEAV